jgi:predicted permease
MRLERWLDDGLQDVRFAWRQLCATPTFFLSTVVTLAIGVGANAAIFSLINAFLRPLPVPDPDRIVLFAAQLPGDVTGARYRFSYPAFQDYRDGTRSISDVFAFDIRLGGLTVDGRTTQFLHHFVSGNFFTTLGLTPAIGRFLEPGEGEHLGAELTVVLGHSAWLTRFGGRTDVVGTMMKINGEPARVIGVVPRGFRGLAEGFEMDGYVPLAVWRVARRPERPFSDRGFAYLTLGARLQQGVGLRTVQDAVASIARDLERRFPETEAGVTVRVMPEPLARPVPVRFFADVLPVIRVLLLTLAGVVLALACVNVANLLLVRATIRRRELAVRAALGAGRTRLVRLLLSETLILSILGAAAGIVLGRWASAAVVGSMQLSFDLPMGLDFSLDRRSFVYALAVVLITTAITGIAPAFRAGRANVTAVLHDGGRGSSSGPTRQRLRSVLVVAQVAGSLVLLVIAVLFVRSLRAAQAIDLGFDANNLLTMRISTGQVGYDRARAEAFYAELERRVRATAGVENATLSFLTPMGYIFDTCPVEQEGAASTTDVARPAAGYNTIGTHYFSTLRLPIVRGREFTEHDSASSPRVVIVNETLAATLWPGQDAIGKNLKTYCASTTASTWQVVGVAKTSKYLAVFEQPLPYLYLAATQAQLSSRVLQIRSALAPSDLAARVRREIQTMDADVPVADVRTMNQVLEGGVGYVLFRFGAAQAAAMGLLGLALAVVGVYSVVSYGASQRAQEIGIRLALGAGPRDVQWLIIGQGTGLVLSGVAIGLAASVAATMLVARFLVLVTATGPSTWIVATMALVAVAFVACYLPARRAMRLDPISVLRCE